MRKDEKMDNLENLSQLIKARNVIDNEIATIINRPALNGHIGEYIAIHIFDIKLYKDANHKGSDGVFFSGNLKGKSVNIKCYGKNEHLLDINLQFLPDFYLVLTGTKSAATSSIGIIRPFIIESVFLFDAVQLIETLKERGVIIGDATSVISSMWDAACIYPNKNKLMPLKEEYRLLLSYFNK